MTYRPMDDVRGSRLRAPLAARMKVGVIVLHFRVGAMNY